MAPPRSASLLGPPPRSVAMLLLSASASGSWTAGTGVGPAIGIGRHASRPAMAPRIGCPLPQPRVQPASMCDAVGSVAPLEQPGRWSSGLGIRNRLRLLRRSWVIWSCCVLQAWRVFVLRRKYADRRESPEAVEARRVLAAGLRDTLIRLGPTFIKVGQLLSTRVDVLPPEVIGELSRLQNEVPGFPGKRAKQLVKRELGKPVEELFASFDDAPLAAASLAQVHRARLHSGDEVVVKVQRENLRQLFDVDLFNIRLVASLADRLDPQTEALASNWRGVAETSGDVLYREIDFRIEQHAATEFRANFAKDKTIKVPAMYPELCTSRLLTMEYCPGKKITDTEALQREARGAESRAETPTSTPPPPPPLTGFFHCDPHPGNLAVDDGFPGGRLIYQNMPREACDALETMGVLRKGVDRFSIERIARNMLGSFQSTLASADNKWENEMTPEEKRESRRNRRAQLGQDLFATQAERPFLFPPKFTFVFRAFSTIDGIGKTLTGPRYDLSRISQPYLRELADLRDGSALKSAALELGRRVGWRPQDVAQLVTQPRAVAGVAQRVRKLEEGDLKLRVRTLEVERMIERVELRQRFIGAGVASALLLHISLGATLHRLAARVVQVIAARVAWECWNAWLALKKLTVQQLRFENEDTVYDTM
ncbi:hypothetical protein EMIHUDRAFT_435521 [Emiliania huxleyi CCMP1516]|uniref:ABC1 atypical kinase-like domain-containing protein n=2 Tax=Emiliania huxleyi TaxID=2903 RepID=A0A0D3JKK0_EMIH1|nr:hypothetical protein EMIHUDRAFT_435521 [Emiliania huxleyi CCMP1516]EOD24035.1 hypothetical protein EMIHUDRAFT_435521 [Emiliania huxleyi CCMP1516]|eukprot:XP_005776464.1 hypothetical protein EMIHUDRAFT_435521 [Emiliania huxleyi CCMP1516]